MTGFWCGGVRQRGGAMASSWRGDRGRAHAGFRSRYWLASTSSVSALALAAVAWPTSSALAVCSTSGAAPVTFTCSGTVTTINTTNATSPNANTVDRNQFFNDSISGTINTGAVINGAGFNLTSAVNGSTVSLTNNGSVTSTVAPVVELGGSGTNSTLTYGGSGNIQAATAGAALSVLGAGTGSASITVSGTSTIQAQIAGAAFNGQGIVVNASTGGTASVVVQAGGLVQGTNGVEFDFTGTNSVNNAGGIGTNLTATPGVISVNGIAGDSLNDNSIAVTNQGTGTISGSNAGITVRSGGSVAITNNLGGSITGTGATSFGIGAGSVTGSNAGTISGITSGIDTTGAATLDHQNGTSVNLTSNSGSILGTGAGGNGINAWTSVNVTTNSGTIQGGQSGIVGDISGGGFSVTIGTNSNTISGLALNGITDLGGTVTVTTNAQGATISGGGSGIVGGSVGVGSNAGTISGGTGSGIVSGGNLSVTNASTGTISGGSAGINFGGTTATVTNNGGLIAGGNQGVFLSAGSASITNGTGGTISGTGAGGDGIFTSASSVAVTLGNAGTVSGTSIGIGAPAGGTLTITSNTGSITGGLSAISTSGTATITNNSGGQITSGAGGGAIEMGAGLLTLTNSGLVSGGSAGAISSSVGSLNITNNSGGTITSANAALGAIFFTASSTIANAGSITATGAGTVGIFASGAGANLTITGNTGAITATGTNAIGVAASTMTVTNNAGGTISGDLDGINQQAGTGPATINNMGTISGAGRTGVRLGNNATVNNISTGTITGVTGIVFRDPTASNTPIVNGSVFNSGTITGTGGTAINFSTAPNGSGPFTLTLGPGSVINGNVLGKAGTADNFQLGGTGSDTFNLSNFGAAQQYQGFTTFAKIGSSTWTVTGTFAQTQGWTVSGGTLLVNGDLSNATSTTVTAPGILGGTGSVGNTNINGGTLAPGVNGVGALAIKGNLAFQSASLYMVGINGSAASHATVTGSATLAGSVQAVFQGGALQQKYAILTAGSVSGTFSNLTTTSLPAFITASLSYTPTEVDLNLTTVSPSALGLTGNQTAVLTAMEQAFNSGGGALAGLSGLSGAQLAAALNALSGEGLSGAEEGAFGAGGMFLSALWDQVESWLTGEPRGDGGGAMAMGYAAAKPVAPVFKATPLKAAPYVPQWRTWTAGFDGSWSLKGEAQQGSADLSHRSAGGVAGVDRQVAPDLLVGAAVGGSASSFSVPDRATTGTLDGAHIGVYAVGRRAGWYTAGTVSFQVFDNKTSRTVAGVGPTEIETARFNSDMVGGRIETGFRQAYGSFTVTPFAALQFATLHLAGFTESGTTVGGAPGVLGLTVSAHNVNSLPTFLGVQFDNRMVLANGMTWTPYARVAWVHEFDPNRDIAASFITLPAASFTVDGPRAAPDSAHVDVGSKLAVSHNVFLFDSFDGEFAPRSQMYAGKAGVLVNW